MNTNGFFKKGQSHRALSTKGFCKTLKRDLTVKSWKHLDSKKVENLFYVVISPKIEKKANGTLDTKDNHKVFYSFAGCTMTLAQIGQHARRPKGVIIALFAQFIIMPAAAFGLTRAFNLEVFAAMAVLICGCCPGGNLSNMLAYALNGDMNLR